MVVFLNSLYYLFHILRRLEMDGPRVAAMAQKYAQARFSLFSICFLLDFCPCTQHLRDIAGFFSNIVPTQSKNMKYDHCSLSFYASSLNLTHALSCVSYISRQVFPTPICLNPSFLWAPGPNVQLFLLHLMPWIPQTQHDPNKIHNSHPPTSHTSSSHVPSLIDLVIHVRSVASSMEPSFLLPLSNQSSIIFLKIPLELRDIEISWFLFKSSPLSTP